MEKKVSKRYRGLVTQAVLRHALMWADLVRGKMHWNKSDSNTYFLIKEEIKQRQHEYYKVRKNSVSGKKKIVFDVDGTLITTDKDPQPRKEIIDLALSFSMMGWEIWVHSGGGVLYAKRWVEFLGMDKMFHVNIAIKGDSKIHYNIAVDDCLDEVDWTKEKTGNFINADYYINV